MNDRAELNAESVSEFLLDHPDFLLTHADVLARLQLPHESGQAVSLIERQVDQLREKADQQQGQLTQLIRVARENEALMIRVHNLTLELMTIGDLGIFFDRLSAVLTEEFEADVLKITLHDREIIAGENTPLSTIARDDAHLEPLRELLEKGESRCGRLNRAKLEALFGEQAQWVQSTALIPIEGHGFLAVGSSDPARYFPGMGTLFLDMLAKVIETRLLIETPEQQRRTA